MGCSFLAGVQALAPTIAGAAKQVGNIKDGGGDDVGGKLYSKNNVATLKGVGECMKSMREKKGQNKSPCCVSWGDETRAVSHEKTRQGSTPHHAKTSLEGIQKQSHMAKPHGQKIQKIQEDMFKWPKDM